MVARKSESAYKMLNTVGTQEMEGTIITNDFFPENVSCQKEISGSLFAL